MKTQKIKKSDIKEKYQVISLDKNESETDYDFVKNPKHYINHKIITKDGEFEYETIEYLEALARRLSKYLTSDEIFDITSGAKYLDGLRGDKPDGDKTPRQKIAEDCEKTAWYLTRAAWLIKENGV